MEYHLYTTPALVLARSPAGEANVTVWLLTRDCGLLQANAQRARDVTSKLRFGLQVLSLSTMTLVRGRHRWRVITVIPRRSYFSRWRHSFDRQRVGSVVLSTLRHLVAGEERDPELFFLVLNFLNWLSGGAANTKPDLEAGERLMVLRLLHHLGYVAEEPGLTPFLHSAGVSAPLLAEMRRRQAAVTRIINQALGASQLAPASR